MAAMVETSVIDRLKAAVGPKGYAQDPRVMAPYLVEWRDRYVGRTPIVLFPADAREVAAVVGICAEAGVAMVPQGGNTGLVGGGVPHETGEEIVINLSRMNRVLAVDPVDFSATVEAGAPLAAVQQAAADVDRLFPLSLASEGSAEIGGLISTNAGGVHVLKYGTMRDLVLGLEVVLPSGALWDGRTALRKDNTGYDLKQLFIGAEGTLGIVTAATLKLFPALHSTETALAGVPSPAAAIELLARARAASGDRVIAFELMPRIGLAMVLDHIPDTRDPLADSHPWYVLIDLASTAADPSLAAVLERLLADAAEAGLVTDAVVAASLDQARALWRLRDAMSEAQKYEGGSIKHDVSVPVARMAAFIEQASKAVAAALPGIRPVPFGHVGDGNVHFNLSQPVGADKAAFLDRWQDMNRIVHDVLLSLGGSISAEHGIGRMKVDELARLKSPTELALMRQVKDALDPDGLMNPGKVLAVRQRRR